jgi:hypothetical protein
MRRSFLTLLAASAGVAAWCSTASAQGVGVDVYVGPSYDRYYSEYPAYRRYYYAPPAYGYYYRRGDYFERPEHYRYGSRRWWRQMDRAGRGGHQD